MHVLDGGVDEADFARAKARVDLALRSEHANLIHLMHAPGRHDLDLVARLDLALHHPHQRHHAKVVVEPGVDDQRLQLVGVARLWRRDARHDRFEHVAHVESGLGADRNRIVRIDADHGLDLLLDLLGIGGWKVDLVQTGTTSRPCSTAV
jgi:hypothetical protein